MRLALAAVLVPSLALANGRAPQTNGVFVGGDAHALLVRTTFGLLISKDDGRFQWVCERAIGYGGEFDPKYAIATDGTIFATTFTGLRVSRDGGCTWSTATAEKPMGDPGNISDIWIDALDISPTGEIWVATAESARPNNVYSSTDNGVTFQPRGLQSPTIWWKSVKVAKSNPQRVYLSGYQVASPPKAHLMRSDSGGTAWAELELPPAMKFGPTPIVYVSAVDPKHPDTLLLTSANANGTGDRLYRSTNAGDTFDEVLATTDPIKAVVFADNGTVYVAALTGSFKSTDNGQTFEPLAGSPQLNCLAQRPDGSLIGCGANWDPDFKAVASTADAHNWSKLFRFVELGGPLACMPGTTTFDKCNPLWPSLQQQFGAGPTRGATADAAETPPVPKPPRGGGGCCDSSGGAGGALVALGGLALASRATSRARARRRARA
jgi:hypothetical protein